VKQLSLACGSGSFSFAFAKDGKHGLYEIVVLFILCMSFRLRTIAII